MAEAVAQAKLALKSDPLSSYAHAICGMTSGCAGKHAEGVEFTRRAVELDSESYLARVIHQATLHLSGQFEESIAAGESALAISGRHWWALAFTATSFADTGKPEEADAVYAEMLVRARRQYAPPAPLAMAAIAAAREEDAILHAREAFETQDPVRQFFFSPHFPYSARLYACPGFRQMVARNGRSDWL